MPSCGTIVRLTPDATRWIVVGLLAAYAMLALTVTAGLLRGLDAAGLAVVQTWRGAALDVLVSLIDVAGRAEVLMPLVGGWCLWRWWRGERRRSVAVFGGLLLVLLVNPIVKQLIDQPPPGAEFARYVLPLRFPSAEAALSGAFHSGHASRAAWLAIVVAGSLRPDQFRIALALGAAVLLAAWSRIYLGAHWPSDVAGGLLFGAAAGLVTLFAAGRRSHRGFIHRTAILAD